MVINDKAIKPDILMRCSKTVMAHNAPVESNELLITRIHNTKSSIFLVNTMNRTNSEMITQNSKVYSTGETSITMKKHITRMFKIQKLFSNIYLIKYILYFEVFPQFADIPHRCSLCGNPLQKLRNQCLHILSNFSEYIAV